MATSISQPATKDYLGCAAIRAIIERSGEQVVAECYVQDGSVWNGCAIRVKRHNTLVHRDTIRSLRSTDKNVIQVLKGQSCHIGLRAYSNVRVGDILEAFGAAPDSLDVPAIQVPIVPPRVAQAQITLNGGIAQSAAPPIVQNPLLDHPTAALPSAAHISSSTGGAPSVSNSLNTEALMLPRSFTFYRGGFLDFDKVLRHFDWNFSGPSLTIDLSECLSANFQALTLLIQYAWYLTTCGCNVTFKYGLAQLGPTKMLRTMGAGEWREILLHDGRDFGYDQRRTFALRRRSDVKNTINNTRAIIGDWSHGFPDYLSYIVSELLYNATEHGRWAAEIGNSQVIVPAIYQFGNYTALNRVSFIFTDLGIGIKAHLEQTYSAFPTHQEAITAALRPNVSGTFLPESGAYAGNNNAGMGLTYSSTMLRRLRGDMYIVSHDGLVHVSPADVTSRQLEKGWRGTFVLININVEEQSTVPVEQLLAEIRANAQKEIDGVSKEEESSRYSISIFNHFGKWAEDKDAAIAFRDNRLLPAIDAGKRIELDFRDVETAPHSFLNALLAAAIKKIGVRAYQCIKAYNAPGTIHEIIDKIFEDNLPLMR